MGDGKEGDWECGGCRNRNYAFRSFCNRCKQPRILVDANTPSDSKWLPRIGDWICKGCTNNNYASREKCKKCGQPKEVAAMPALGMPGSPFHTHSSYLPRAQTGLEQRLNLGLLANAALHNSLPFSANWPGGLGGAEKFRFPASSSWPLAGNPSSGHPYTNSIPNPVPKGWRNGDWICNCGFHNYTSRTQCKKCNAAAPSALGTKRLASEDPANDWEKKRLNAGPVDEILLANRLAQTYSGLEQITLPGINLRTGVRPPFLWGNSSALPFSQPAPPPQAKGTKQWRDGDWMCTNCNNHNYASRSECNRCKTEKEAAPSASLPVGVS